MELPIVPLYHRIHKLAPNTLSLMIPKGPKFFASFTYLNNKPICYLIDKTGKREHKYVSFREELSMGTLLYGTLISNYFVCEHVYLFKNEKVKDTLDVQKEILGMIKDSEYLGSISFKLPHMAINSFFLECSNLPYPVYGIVQNKKMLILQNMICGFQIKKCEGEDIYKLYGLEEKEMVYHSNALVNDFKTSHFLKSLFYKKKANYKSIEFSDSENEESERDIFVGCLYIPEFKKWKPYNLKPPDFIKNIGLIEKKYIAV